MRSVARGALLVATLGTLLMGADCGPPRRPEIRQGSKSYLFNITSDPIPPYAREDVIYTVTVRAEGGHYTFVEAATDQMGESRMDRNVKRFFVRLHRAEDPSHTLQASY